MHPRHDNILSDISTWIESMVIALELCPFAPKAVDNGELKLQICAHSDTEVVLTELYELILSQLSAGGDATALLILPTGFDDFDDYLDLLAMAEELLVMQKLDMDVQLASFHPHYLFEGTDNNDPSNYTNRSPYPMIHLLQEASVTRAVDHYPDTDLIAARNIAKLESMGLEAILTRIGKPTTP